MNWTRLVTSLLATAAFVMPAAAAQNTSIPPPSAHYTAAATSAPVPRMAPPHAAIPTVGKPNFVRVPSNTVFNNLLPAAKYPNSTYWAGNQSTYSGWQITQGQWIASQFIAPRSGWISEVTVGAVLISGGYSVSVLFFTDSGSNTPGTSMGNGYDLPALPPLGSCCTTTSLVFGAKTFQVVAGQKYWVVLGVDGTTTAVWNWNLADQSSDVQQAISQDDGESWTNFTGQAQTVALSVAVR